MAPDESATVRLVDIYARQIEMGTLLAVITEQLKTAADRGNDHEARLRALERWRYALPLSALGALASAALAAAAFLHH